MLWEILCGTSDIFTELVAKIWDTSELSWNCSSRFSRTCQRKTDPCRYLIELSLLYLATRRNQGERTGLKAKHIKVILKSGKNRVEKERKICQVTKNGEKMLKSRKQESKGALR